jgi:hypothetical protein
MTNDTYITTTIMAARSTTGERKQARQPSRAVPNDVGLSSRAMGPLELKARKQERQVSLGLRRHDAQGFPAREHEMIMQRLKGALRPLADRALRHCRRKLGPDEGSHDKFREIARSEEEDDGAGVAVLGPGNEGGRGSVQGRHGRPPSNKMSLPAGNMVLKYLPKSGHIDSSEIVVDLERDPSGRGSLARPSASRTEFQGFEFATRESLRAPAIGPLPQGEGR